MSPRAAARLDSLGFDRVYDLRGPQGRLPGPRACPEEGPRERQTRQRAADLMRSDAVRCRLGGPDRSRQGRGRGVAPYGFAPSSSTKTRSLPGAAAARSALQGGRLGECRGRRWRPGHRRSAPTPPWRSSADRLEGAGLKLRGPSPLPDGVLLGGRLPRRSARRFDAAAARRSQARKWAYPLPLRGLISHALAAAIDQSARTRRGTARRLSPRRASWRKLMEQRAPTPGLGKGARAKNGKDHR